MSLEREYYPPEDEGLQARIAELEAELQNLKQIGTASDSFKVKIVNTEEEIIKLAEQGWGCQQNGNGKWLMKKGYPS